MFPNYFDMQFRKALRLLPARVVLTLRLHARDLRPNSLRSERWSAVERRL